ncbi:zinc finger, CCHC-type containing protein [Tanacetum coccineum]
MTEMFRLLKELTTSRALEKVLLREEAKLPITKNVNSISLAKGEEERRDKTNETLDNTVKPTITETKILVIEAEKSNETKNKPIKKAEREEVKVVLSSRPGPSWEAKGGLKHVNALVDQESDVNVIPYSTYIKLTDEMPTKTNIRLSLAKHSYIYPLGIAEDVLVEVTGHVYPLDFVILDIKENEMRPFILGTPFLTTAKAIIKFHKCTITLTSGKRSGYHQKDRKPSQNDKTEHGMEKTVQNQGQSPKMSKSESILKNQQSNRSRN